MRAANWIRRIAVVFLACGLAACGQPLASREDTQSLPRLSHSGRWLTDDQGRVVMLRGGNIGTLKDFPPDPQSGKRPAWSDDTPKRMAAAGFNAVRLVFFFDRVMPEPGHIDETYLDAIARTVAAYRAAGIYTLLDFHQDEYGPSVGVRGFPAWATFTDGHTRIPGMQFPNGYFSDPAVQHAFDNFWADHEVPGTGQGVQELYIDGLTAMARRFADKPAVFGIDVMNEPATGSFCARPDPVKANCPELEQKLLAPFYAKIGRALAPVASNTLIFVEPFMLQGALGVPLETPSPGVPKLNGLSYHNYGPLQAFRDKTNDSAVARATVTDSALINTEWGNTNDAAELARQAQDFDDRMIPWLAWTVGPFEALFAARQDQRPEVNAVLRAYARPFPTATAGTPLLLRFDPDSGALDFIYSTTEPDGRRALPETLTEIRIPPSNFPDDYTVAVIHGTVASPANAPVLLIRSEPDAAKVEVRIARVGALAPLPDSGKGPPPVRPTDA